MDERGCDDLLIDHALLDAAFPDDQLVDDQQWQTLIAAIVAAGPSDDTDTGTASDTAIDTASRTAGTAAQALSDAPGLSLVRALTRLQPSALRGADAIAYLRATERAIAWLTARQAASLVAIAGPRTRVDRYEIPDAPVISIEDASRSEIAAATAWSESWTHERITTARLLEGPLPLTRAALAAGEITPRHADVIAAAAQRLSGWVDWITADPDSLHASGHAASSAADDFERMSAELESTVLLTARRRGLAATRRAADLLVVRIDADHAASRRRMARTGRDVTVHEDGDGISILTARLATEQAHACMAMVDSLARDPRLILFPGTSAQAGIGERRAEALVQLLLHAAPAAPGSPTAPHAAAEPPSPPATAPIRTHVDVVIDLTTLLGLAEQSATLRSGGPGGSVPVAADVVRRLIANDPDATMRRLVSDPLTGHLLDRARSSYRIPSSLRAYLIARDVTCRFPNCQRRADLAQIDHARAWEDGGGTDRANLGALCVRHHQLKTHAGWRITHSAPDGSCRWRSPVGLTYEHDATPTGPPLPSSHDVERPSRTSRSATR